ncbi:hypothetical protein [Rhizobium sp. Rhizsp82]|uniref:hypothetical protein n=1 Tax=Rhizobium sp. Rhizsp82 TaxID=3243057 RepID=UPI0039B661CC
MGRHWRILTALLSLALVSAGPADDGRWYAGDFSFSDELGGFHILAISGSGTRDDPIEITEAMTSSDPVTLIIRAANPTTLDTLRQNSMHLRMVTVNESKLAWIGFEFELEEIRGKPSDFYDGLSFGQTNPNPDFISSDRFAHFQNQFESFDRLRFDQGHADPKTKASFGFFVTDVTPVPEFFLVQDPLIPDS